MRSASGFAVALHVKVVVVRLPNLLVIVDPGRSATIDLAILASTHYAVRTGSSSVSHEFYRLRPSVLNHRVAQNVEWIDLQVERVERRRAFDSTSTVDGHLLRGKTECGQVDTKEITSFRNFCLLGTTWPAVCPTLGSAAASDRAADQNRSNQDVRSCARHSTIVRFTTVSNLVIA